MLSIVDLVQGYHEALSAEEGISKTAVITSFDLFKFLHVLFGLKNAA